MAAHNANERPPVTAIVPAGGASTRFRGSNKLLMPLGGTTILERTVERARASSLDDIIVVTGFDRKRVETAMKYMDIRTVFNPDFEDGMSSSIVSGVRAAAPDHDILIWPGDMPLIDPKTVVVVVKRGKHDAIVIPVFGGRRGHPVLFGSAFRSDLLSLSDDRGARSVLERHRESMVEAAVSDPGIHRDVDTLQDLMDVAQIVDPGGQSSD